MMIEITAPIVQELINSQFPQWKHLPIRPVEKSGHDNRTFHLGEEMSIRLPSGADYAAQVEKELKWLPVLQQFLSMPISSPIATGQPDRCYPFSWSVNRFIKGETVNQTNIGKMQLAASLADFLRELQAIDTANAPVAGPHNFHRGGKLSIYQEQTDAALLQLEDELPTDMQRKIWERAVSSEWPHRAVWLHGDVVPGNLLVDHGVLCAVIDFGIMGVGDPSCDYAMAWTFFDKGSRKAFLCGLDEDTVDRARGWALWKALITYRSDNIEALNNARFTIQSILDEMRRGNGDRD